MPYRSCEVCVFPPWGGVWAPPKFVFFSKFASKHFNDPKPREKLAYVNIERDQAKNTEFLWVETENNSPADKMSREEAGEGLKEQKVRVPRWDKVVGRKTVDRDTGETLEET